MVLHFPSKYRYEALLFAVQTGISSELTAGEQLRAKLVAHEENACDFVSVTEDTGVRFALDGIRAPWKIYCMILAESVQTISKGRLIRPMGRLSIPELIRLNYALLYQLDLNEWVWRKEAYERYLRYHR